MEKVRINKYLASIGVASRREIDRLIEEKRILVNGRLATSGEKVSDEDSIEVNGKSINNKITEQKKVYFLLNKPAGTLSSASDDRGRKTVVELIDTKERIFPIGRLDFETEGAIILTNDGELFNRVIHPRTEVYKEYYVEVTGYVVDSEIAKLESGVKLDDESVTLPAIVKVISRTESKSVILISIREGKNRQIRRMIQAVGHRVTYLRREKIGEINLQGLNVGEYRELTKAELDYLYSIA